MEFIFTNHARKRVVERKISKEQIQETIDFPDYTIRKDGKTESYKKIENKTLKIIYVLKGKFIKIVTLMWK